MQRCAVRDKAQICEQNRLAAWRAISDMSSGSAARHVEAGRTFTSYPKIPELRIC